MSTKHTPGPWQTARYNYDHATVEVETVRRGTDLPDQGDFIALVGAYGDGPGPDAQLIAAAPDLLAALRVLTAFAASFTGNGCQGDECAVHYDHSDDAGEFYVEVAVAKARAAIAKAEGKDNEESF